MTTPDVVHRVAEVAGGALLRLGRTLGTAHGFAAVAQQLGWAVPAAPAPITAVATQLKAIAARLTAVRTSPDDPAAWTALIDAVAAGVAGIRALGSQSFGPVLDAAGFAAEFSKQLVHWAAIRELGEAHPRVVGVLRAAGIVVARDVPAPGPSRIAYVDERFVLPPFGTVLPQPGTLLRTAWAWAAPGFKPYALLDELAAVFRSYGIATGFVRAPASAREKTGFEPGSSRWHLVTRLLVGRGPAGSYEFGLRFLALTGTGGERGLAIVPFVEGSLAGTVPLGAGLTLAITGLAAAGRAIVVFPTSIDVVDDLFGTGSPGSGALTIAIERPAGAVTTIGAGEAARFSFRGWRLAAIATAGTAGAAELALELTFLDPKLGVSVASSGLLATGGAADRAQLAAPITVGVSARRGVYLGPGGLARDLPGSVAIGPATLRDARISLAGAGDALTARATAGAAVKLGPVAIALDGLGAELALRFPGSGGNLGALDVRAAAIAPSGGSVTLDTAIVRGGGSFQRVAGRDYRGSLALDVLGIEVSALGLVDDSPASRGSFVAAISATFAPVQLGLGFTLSGIGGLVAMHRRADVEAMRTALRGPTGLADLFFPRDPGAQADRLLGELATYFPAARGRHVIGPAVKLGWGTPTLVEGDLAILLELPAPMRLVLIGNVHAALPTRAHPVVALAVDVVGEVDFGRKTVAIDAALRDSTVAGFPITGELAFRMAWGDPPSFALSIGGFHSQFRPPVGFPALRRIRIPIGADDDPRLEVQGFLALTSNTAQVGAQVELYASAGPLNIRGSLGFEALLQLSPFQFRVDLWAGVALRRGSSVLASVHFDGTLTGPTPWRIAGEACLSLWFVDLCVDFDATFGRAEAIELQPTLIWPLLRDALQDPASWSSAMPAGAARAVTIAPPLGDAPRARIDPAASLGVRQKVAPLDRRITRFAEVAPAGTSAFMLHQVRLGGAAMPYAKTTEWFAAAQFEQLSDADRLARPAYEPMIGGVTIAASAVTAGPAQATALTFETILVRDHVATVATAYRPTKLVQLANLATGAAAGAPLRSPAPPPPRAVLAEETYVIASTLDLTPRLDLVPAGSRGDAELALAAFLAANPAARGTLQVVPRFEVQP